ncbi:nucleotide-binding protein [Streptomyces cocklensis]|uniref:Predicted nucleotide-binding protein containing TIR-like domain n=1 Tax=Actinacidiphila cocklensis TaxID=887465 RepID=A0A9W4E160_9ACTN|nr:nucleotide-binding protein [Actinacidiphila cocklensis]MDD1063335.1 nucleotide-binding protein [Actinacidiphila cocklensis]WSX74904.1 nucleotide-binding protein [Streptomyces sp. NBC_00899]CAG6399047.1 Predicted nucleotide-binding protein containing TIR-like domain [Actinacidiphila cocklensis]
MSDSGGYQDKRMTVSGGRNSDFGYVYRPAPAGGPAPDEEEERPAAVRSGAAERDARPASYGIDRGRNVFVVHGRDEEVRREMFALLRRLDLRPLEWEELVRATGKTAPYLGEVVANAPSQAQAALVLLTPDDTAKLHPDLLGDEERADEIRYTGQPRQNVLIELGMVLMAYPERTVIVEVGRLRHAADIEGLNVIRFDGSQSAVSKIVARLAMAGCRLDDTRPEWRETEHFRDLAAYRRRA